MANVINCDDNQDGEDHRIKQQVGHESEFQIKQGEKYRSQKLNCRILPRDLGEAAAAFAPLHKETEDWHHVIPAQFLATVEAGGSSPHDRLPGIIPQNNYIQETANDRAEYKNEENN